MTTISLSATDAILDLMPGQADPCKSPVAAEQGTAPFRLALLPRAWRAALERRARQRDLELAFERLSETSAHLLADVGLETPEAAKGAPAPTWTRALPAPGVPAMPAPVSRWGLSRSRRRLLDLDDHLLSDIGATRSQVQDEIRRPRWDPPEAWLR